MKVSDLSELRRSVYTSLRIVEVLTNLSNHEEENAKGHQTRSRRRPSGLRPNSSEFFKYRPIEQTRLGEKKNSSEFFEIRRIA